MLKDLFLKGKIKINRQNPQQNGSSESGRTMTEMLGVLVIMGILSLGGIAGYRYGMNKYKANETIAELSLYVVDIATQMINDESADIQLGHLPLKTRMEYPLSVYLGETAGYFELEVSTVPTGVCKQILRSEWQVPEAIIVNDAFVNKTEDIIDGTVSVDDACNQAENTVAFEFYKTLTPCEGDECIGSGTGGSDSGSEDPDAPEDWMDTPSCEDGFFWNWNQEQCVLETCEEGYFTTGSGCERCPTSAGQSVTVRSDVSDSCLRSCSNTTLSGYVNSNYFYQDMLCLNCPAPGIPCGTDCCSEDEVCRREWNFSWGESYYTCGTPLCHSNDDCPTGVCDPNSGCVACMSHSDCGSGQYCQGITDCDGKGFGSTQCVSLSGDYVTLNGHEWYYSRQAETWYSAQDICESVGKRLASVQEVEAIETELDKVWLAHKAHACWATTYSYHDGYDSIGKLMGGIWAGALCY